MLKVHVQITNDVMRWLGLMSIGANMLVLGACASQEPTTVRRRTPESEFPIPAESAEGAEDAKKQKQLDEQAQQKAKDQASGTPNTGAVSGGATTQGDSMKTLETNSPKTDTGVSSSTKTGTENTTAQLNFDGFFYPLKMKECLDMGKVYDRATLDCHATQIIASPSSGFTCSKTGIITAFDNSDVVAKQLDLKIQANWKIDQCGFEPNQKKVVSFVCFTDKTQACNANPVCKDPKDLDPKETRFCMSKISES